MKKLTIYYIMDDFNKAGGWERQCSLMAKGLQDRGYQVCVFSRQYVAKDNQYRQFFETNRIPFCQVNVLFALIIKLIRSSRLEKIADFLLSKIFIFNLTVRSIFRKPDIIHAISPCPATMYCLSWLKRKKIPLLYDEENMVKFDQYNYLYKYQEICKAAAVFKVLSPALSEHAAKFIPSDLRRVVILPLIDLPRLAAASQKKKQLVVGTVGRAEPEKGFENFVEAAREIHAKFPQAKFVLVGEGRLLPQIKKMVKNYGLDESFTFKGFLSHNAVHAFLSEIDIYVQPSKTEGAGIAIVEAMSYAKPVVTTACGGPTSIVKDGESGLIVPIEDPQALASAIMRLIASPDERQRMGQKGRALFLKDYNPDKLIDQYVQLYEEVTGVKD